MIHYLFYLMLGSSQYGAFHAHQDSVYLYNAHKESIRILENTTEIFALDEKTVKGTENALLRLSRFNNESYEPVDERNKEGIGVAYAYPEPSPIVPVLQADLPTRLPGPSAAPHGPRPIAFKVLDRQTRFITDKNGKTTRPYVLMSYYAAGRILVKTEKLDPVTFEVIQSEEAVIIASN